MGLEDGSFVGDDEGDNEGLAVGTGCTRLKTGYRSIVSTGSVIGSKTKRQHDNLPLVTLMGKSVR